MTNKLPERAFIILDRDGTIIEERGYLSDPDQVTLLPGAGQALRELKQMGYGLVIVTNQSAVGRGYFDETRLQLIHARLRDLLAAEGVQLDGVYICPHKPDDGCLCRKPEVGLVQTASKELGLNPGSSIVIGDKASDIEMGRRAGAKTILVRTGYGAEVAAGNTAAADYVVDDLPAAAALVRRMKKIRGSKFEVSPS